MKMKENPKLDFQRCTTLKRRRNNVDATLSGRSFNVASTLVKAISKPNGLVTSCGFVNRSLSFEILQLRAKFQTMMVPYSKFIWITNSIDHRRV